MRHSRLKPIPGVTCSHVTTKDVVDAEMMTDAMRSMTFGRVMEVFEAHMSGRPDIDAEKLEQFANRIGRLAHMESRK